MTVSLNPSFTYTLEDLREGDFSGTSLAVIGYPVRHSISPQMHNAAIADLRERNDRFKDWTYYRFEIAPETLPEALTIFHQKGFLGLNLTIPHKVIALPLLKSCSEDALRMGAANTLLWGELGYEGFNTDGYGLECALKKDLDISIAGTAIVLLGAGGAARAAAVHCLKAGCSALWIGNRSHSRLYALLESLQGLNRKTPVRGFLLDEDLMPELPATGVLINATSLGLKPEDPLPFDPLRLPQGWSVLDMIYNPATTALLDAAGKAGMAFANGLGMLVFQGARSLEIWSRETVSAHSMIKAACHTLKLPPRYVDNF
jgi:shikimate dehydrogenase